MVAEFLTGDLADTSGEAITLGRALADETGGKLLVFLYGLKPNLRSKLVSFEGVDEILEVSTVSDEFNIDEISYELNSVIRTFTPKVIVAGYTANMSAVAPSIASQLNIGFASDIIECSLDGNNILARRQFFGGKVEGLLEFPADSAFLLIRSGIWKAATLAGDLKISKAIPGTGVSRISELEVTSPVEGDVDLSKSDVILAIGRGVGEKDNIEIFETLATRLGISLASSRPLVDMGWMPKFLQVGQSGVTVKPKLYIALGISGAIQHIAGMQTSETIVAINKDEAAPIFEVAHFGAVLDIFEVAKELEKLL